VNRLRIITCWLFGHRWIVRAVRTTAGLQVLAGGLARTLILRKCGRCTDHWDTIEIPGTWTSEQLGANPTWIPATPAELTEAPA